MGLKDFATELGPVFAQLFQQSDDGEIRKNGFTVNFRAAVISFCISRANTETRSVKVWYWTPEQGEL